MNFFKFSIELFEISALTDKNKWNYALYIFNITYINKKKIKNRALFKIRYTSAKWLTFDILFLQFGFINEWKPKIFWLKKYITVERSWKKTNKLVLFGIFSIVLGSTFLPEYDYLPQSKLIGLSLAGADSILLIFGINSEIKRKNV